MVKKDIRGEFVEETIREELDGYFELKATYQKECTSRMVLAEGESFSGYTESVVIHQEDVPKLLKVIKKFIKDTKNAEKETHAAGTVTSTLPQDTHDNTSGSTGSL